MCLHWETKARTQKKWVCISVCVCVDGQDAFFFMVNVFSSCPLIRLSGGNGQNVASLTDALTALQRTCTCLCWLPVLCMGYEVCHLLHDKKHASNKSVSNVGFVYLFSLSPIPENNSKIPGEFEWKKVKYKYVTIWDNICMMQISWPARTIQGVICIPMWNYW